MATPTVGNGEPGGPAGGDSPRRKAGDLERSGPNAVVAEDIPEAWATYFAYGEWCPDDDQEERWSREEADRWARRYEEEGYVFSGHDERAERSPDTFNGLWGNLQRVLLANNAVIEADHDTGRFSVQGTDDKPTEYVLARGREAAVLLPECFEARLLDAEAEIEDPRRAEESRDRGAGLPGAGQRQWGQEEDPTELDRLWTEEAADRTVRWLAEHGWRIECVLTATEQDGWYRQAWGRCCLYLASRTEEAEPEGLGIRNEYAPVMRDGGPAHWPGESVEVAASFPATRPGYVLHYEPGPHGGGGTEPEVVGTADTAEQLYWLA